MHRLHNVFCVVLTGIDHIVAMLGWFPVVIGTIGVLILNASMGTSLKRFQPHFGNIDPVVEIPGSCILMKESR